MPVTSPRPQCLKVQRGSLTEVMIVFEYLSGQSLRSVAKEYGYSAALVYSVLKRADVTLRQSNKIKRQQDGLTATQRWQNRLHTDADFKAQKLEVTYARKLHREYGISAREYYLLFDYQNGKCAICGGGHIGKRLYLDHCHKTGKVRGILCKYCNALLAMALDREAVLKNAAKYLEDPPFQSQALRDFSAAIE